MSKVLKKTWLGKLKALYVFVAKSPKAVLDTSSAHPSFFFAYTTSISGVAPPSFLYIQAGTTLQMMTSAGAVWSWSTLGILLFFAVLSLLPVFYKQLKQKKE